MSDYILRVTAMDGMVRGFFATSKETVQKALNYHHMTPVATAALGRLLTSGAMMGLMLKGDKDKLTLQLKGDGLGGSILVTSDNKGTVKGYIANPQASVPNKANGKLDVSGLVGKGVLTVIRDEPFGAPYNGSVEIVSGEIAEDIAYYFAQSEQIPSVVSLGVLVQNTKLWQAGGFIIQLLPGATEEVTTYLEEKLKDLPSLTTLYSEGHTPESLVAFFFGENYAITEKVPMDFYCDCSRQKVEKALIAIGKNELETILKEDKKAELHCHFCNKDYHFDENDLKMLINEIK